MNFALLGICAVLFGASAYLLRRTQKLALQTRRIRNTELSEGALFVALEGSLDAVFFLQANMGSAEQSDEVLDFHYKALNHRAETLMERPRLEIIGRGLCELEPRHRVNGFFKKCLQVTQTGETLEEEWAQEGDNGIRWWKQQIVWIPDGVVITRREITVERTTELRLKAALEDQRRMHAWLRDAIEALDAGFALFSHEERLILCNTRYRELYREAADTIRPGASLEEILRAFCRRGGHTHSQLSEDVWVQQRLAEHRQPGHTHEVELRHRFLLVSTRKTAEGGVVNLHHDITERRFQELKLREAEGRFSSIAANIPGMLFQWHKDAQGHIRFPFVSESARDLCGVEAAAIMRDPENFLRLVHPDDRPNLNASMASAFKSESPLRWEGRICTPSGQEKWLQAGSRPVVLASGDRAWDGVVLDVTVARETEIKLEQEKGRVMAQSKMAALGEMAGGIAHEINNPLTAIQWRAEQLQRKAVAGPALPAEEAMRMATEIIKTSQRIHKIIQGLKHFSRDGNNDPCVSESVRKILDDTLTFCASRLTNNDIELIYNGDSVPEDLMIECRSVEISQVLLNLLNNARDAVEKREKKWISLEVKDLGEDVLISLADSGPGIPPELRAKIMEPFFTTKGVGKGTGLGLSLSKGICERHHGSLTYDDRSPYTQFLIRLPKRQPRALKSAA